MQNFRILTAHVKFHQICALMKVLLLLKVYKIPTKNVNRSCLMTLESDA